MIALGFITKLFGTVLDKCLAPFLAYRAAKAKTEEKYAKKELAKIKAEMHRMSKRPHSRADTHKLLDKWIRIIDSSKD